MLQHAFKEWAVVCNALASGRQSLIIRKGGIDEDFSVEHRHFWLFPTYTHQQASGVDADGRELLEGIEAQRPAAGQVRLSHWVDVEGIYRISELLPVQMLAHLHIWSDETIEQRFAYRTPGLTVLAVRVHRAPHVHVIDDRAEFQGCRSWVELTSPLSTAGSLPVLDDAAFRDLQRSLDLLLSPTALA